jgi:hypothetical protein
MRYVRPAGSIAINDQDIPVGRPAYSGKGIVLEWIGYNVTLTNDFNHSRCRGEQKKEIASVETACLMCPKPRKNSACSDNVQILTCATPTSLASFTCRITFDHKDSAPTDWDGSLSSYGIAERRNVSPTPCALAPIHSPQALKALWLAQGCWLARFASATWRDRQKACSRWAIPAELGS